MVRFACIIFVHGNISDRFFLNLPARLFLSLLFSALVDSDFVLGIDCDATALERAMANVRELEMENRISLIQAKVDVIARGSGSGDPEEKSQRGGGRGGGRGRGRSGTKGDLGRGSKSQQHRRPPASLRSVEGVNAGTESCMFPLSDNCVDTVVTNPPFGTKPDKAGIDMQFLKLACRLARRAVYSFHKSSTRDYVLRTMNALPKVASVTVVAEMKFDLPRTYKFHQQTSVDVEVDLIWVELVRICDDNSENDNASSVSVSEA